MSEMVLNVLCGLANPQKILYVVGTIIPISKMRKVRHRGVRYLAQGHTASKVVESGFKIRQSGPRFHSRNGKFSLVQVCLRGSPGVRISL